MTLCEHGLNWYLKHITFVRVKHAKSVFLGDPHVDQNIQPLGWENIMTLVVMCFLSKPSIRNLKCSFIRSVYVVRMSVTLLWGVIRSQNSSAIGKVRLKTCSWPVFKQKSKWKDVYFHFYKNWRFIAFQLRFRSTLSYSHQSETVFFFVLFCYLITKSINKPHRCGVVHSMYVILSHTLCQLGQSSKI